MKKKRYLPFGYKIVDGKTSVVNNQAELIKNIFISYISGSSLQNLSSLASASGITYSENTLKWNKNIIARILQCEKYIGKQNFPSIIKTELFEKAQELRKEKSASYGGALAATLKPIRNNICCEKCESKLVRLNQRDGVYVKWHCKICDWETSCISDEELLQKAIDIMKNIVEQPNLIKRDIKQSTNISLTAHKLEQGFLRDLGNPKADSKLLLNKIIECAQEQYRACNDCILNLETDRLLQQLSEFQSIDKFTALHLAQISEKIFINKENIVSLKIKNGVILRSF